MPKKQPAGGLTKPPKLPPTALGTQPHLPPPSGGPPRQPGRLVVVAGAKDGVGATAVCLNLALAWARTQKRKAVIVPLDLRCPDGLLRADSPTVLELTKHLGAAPERLVAKFRALVRFNDWGVGILPLASNAEEALALSPVNASAVLSLLGETCDLFFDTGLDLAMRRYAFELADIVFWVTPPERQGVDATAAQLSDKEAPWLLPERFEVVVNETAMAPALTPKEVTRQFGALKKRVLVWLPYEKALAAKKALVVESVRSEWVDSGLAVLLGRALEAAPRKKNWNCREDAWACRD